LGESLAQGERDPRIKARELSLATADEDELEGAEQIELLPLGEGVEAKVPEPFQ
jgi:hypothetical protein